MNQWNYQILEAYKPMKQCVAAFRLVKIPPLLGSLCLISVLFIYSSLCPYPGSFRTKLSLNESSEQATTVVSHVTHDTQGGELGNVELVLLVLYYSTILLLRGNLEMYQFSAPRRYTSPACAQIVESDKGSP